MIYFLQSQQPYLLDLELDKITKKCLKEKNDFNFITILGNNSSSKEVYNEIDTYSFTGDSKIILIKNFTEIDGLDDKVFLDYLKNLNSENIVVFYSYNEKIDKKKPLHNFLCQLENYIEIKDIDKNNKVDYIKKILDLENVKINNDALKVFVGKMPDDLMFISTEVKKLSVLDGEITIDIVEKLIPKQLEDNIFDLVEAVIKKNITKVFIVFNDFKLKKEPPIKILAVLASQIRFYMQIKILEQKNLSENSIAEKLQSHPYRVKIALQNLNYVKISTLQNILGNLAQLDANIKNGEIDGYLGLELLFLNSVKS